MSADLPNQTQNVQVAIQTLTNLSQYTYYYWRVDVSDGKATTEGDVQAQVRTYCGASPCSGGVRSQVSCPKTVTTTKQCSGQGYFREIGEGSSQRCDICKTYNYPIRSIFECPVCGETKENFVCTGCRKNLVTCDEFATNTTTCGKCNGTRLLLYLCELYAQLWIWVVSLLL